MLHQMATFLRIKMVTYTITLMLEPREFYIINEECYICYRKFYVSQVDFTNPEAVSWYQSQLARAINLSFHGWMYDYGEYTPYDSVASDGTIGQLYYNHVHHNYLCLSGLEMHNKVSHLYQKAAYDYLLRLDKTPNDSYAPDYVFYVR